MYCSLDDLKQLQTEELLLQLTDDNGVGAFVTSPANQPYLAVVQAIGDADTLINAYLSGRYTVPIAAPIPPMVRQISANLALCNLYDRRRELDVPEGIAARRKRFVQVLTDIKTERADIPELTTVAIAPAAFLVSKTAADEIFSDELLSRM